ACRGLGERGGQDFAHLVRTQVPDSCRGCYLRAAPDHLVGDRVRGEGAGLGGEGTLLPLLSRRLPFLAGLHPASSVGAVIDLRPPMLLGALVSEDEFVTEPRPSLDRAARHLLPPLRVLVAPVVLTHPVRGDEIRGAVLDLLLDRGSGHATVRVVGGGAGHSGAGAESGAVLAHGQFSLWSCPRSVFTTLMGQSMSRDRSQASRLSRCRWAMSTTSHVPSVWRART